MKYLCYVAIDKNDHSLLKSYHRALNLQAKVCDSSSHWSLSPPETTPTTATHELFPQPSHICQWCLIPCSLRCSKVRQTELILVTPEKAVLLYGLFAYLHTLLCSPDPWWIDSTQDQKSHSQWKVRFFVPALRAQSVQQGSHELAQGKNKEEDEEGRPPSQFKEAHHTINIVVPATWKGAPSVPSDFKGRWAHASESSRVWCEESWWDLFLLFSRNKCPFPNTPCFWEKQILKGHFHDSENEVNPTLTRHLFPLHQ